MRPDDFFQDVDEDVFGMSLPTRKLNRALLVDLRRGPTDGLGDLEVAVALARLVHDELEAFGTAGGQQMDEHEIREALLALRAVTRRVGVSLEVPFRDYSTFKTYWLKHDGYGSWQARREMLGEIFDDAHDKLIELESSALASSLVDPISPRGRTGWSRIDEEIAELRHAANAPGGGGLVTLALGVAEAELEQPRRLGARPSIPELATTSGREHVE